MFTISTFSAILYFLLTGGIAFAIGSYWKSRNTDDWQGKFDALVKEKKALISENKKSNKRINHIEQSSNSWKEKFEESESKYIPQIDKLKEEINTLRGSSHSKTEELSKMTTDRDRKASRVEKLEKEITNLKEKYNTDLGDSKDWKRKRDALQRQVKEFQVKHAKSQREVELLRKRLEDQTQQIKEAKSFVDSLRKIKVQNKKLTTDLEYWEQMHYKTHHELTATKETLEKLQNSHDELGEINKGEEILKQNMLTKIEEYKTKFVNMNNKYHKLLEKNGGIGSA